MCDFATFEVKTEQLLRMQTRFLPLLFILFSVHGFAQNLYFPPTSGNNWDTLSPTSLGWCTDQISPLYQFLNDNDTKAFILLKDGKIVLEKYFGTFTQDSVWYWASAGKSVTGFLVGKAQEEGYLSIQDPTSDYLGNDWTSCTPTEEDQITVWNQLTMTSGMDDSDQADCTDDTCLHCITNPGERWAYHNAPYTLLDGVIENATGSSLNAYFNQKLKVPTGMTGLYISIGYNNVLYSKPRSMARFGLLMLNNGIWDGTPVLDDTAYMNAMVNTSQQLNKAYGYLWWLNGKTDYMIPQSQLVLNGSMMPDAPDDMFSAIGKNGQFLNIVPNQNLVMVRMGRESTSTNYLVPTQMNNDIWPYLDAVMCNSTAIEEQKNFENTVQVYPNPAVNSVQIQANTPIQQVIVYSLTGKELLRVLPAQNQTLLDVSTLPAGVYLTQVQTQNAVITQQLVITQQ